MPEIDHILISIQLFCFKTIELFKLFKYGRHSSHNFNDGFFR